MSFSKGLLSFTSMGIFRPTCAKPLTSACRIQSLLELEFEISSPSPGELAVILPLGTPSAYCSDCLMRTF